MYKELAKIRRNSGRTFGETILSIEQPEATVFTHHSGKMDHNNKDQVDETMQIKRDYGAGVQVTIQRFAKNRMFETTLSLGKSDIELLKKFIEMVEPELRDYHGEFIPQRLISLK